METLKMKIMLVSILCITAISSVLATPPPPNVWSNIIDAGFYIVCPNSNPETYCDIHVRYKYRQLTNSLGEVISNDILLLSMDYADDCACVGEVDRAVLDYLLWTENVYFSPGNRIPGSDIVININIMTASPCMEKQYYYKLGEKWYRYVACEMYEICTNNYDATFHQPTNHTDPAWGDLTNIDLMSSPGIETCTAPCQTWCNRYALSGPCSIIIDNYELDEEDVYTGPTYSEYVAPKVNIGSYNDDIVISPNPAQNDLSISFNNDNNGLMEISIIDLSGNIIDKFISEKTTVQVFHNINISKFAKGTYNLRISLNDEIIGYKNFVIAR